MIKIRKDQYHKKQKTEEETKGKNIFSIQKKKTKKYTMENKIESKIDVFDFQCFFDSF